MIHRRSSCVWLIVICWLEAILGIICQRPLAPAAECANGSLWLSTNGSSANSAGKSLVMVVERIKCMVSLDRSMAVYKDCGFFWYQNMYFLTKGSFSADFNLKCWRMTSHKLLSWMHK